MKTRTNLLVATLLATLIASPAAAFTTQQLTVEEAGDFVVEPAKIELFADPGEVIVKTISVVNRNRERMTYKLELEDFVGAEDGSVAVKLIGDDTSPYSFKSSIAPEVSEFTLGFGEKAIIPVTITVPATQSPGGYYTSVIVSNAPSREGQPGTTSGTQVVSRIAQLLFVRVNGDVLEEGRVKDFRMSPPKMLYQGGPYKFEVLFENTGNVHLTPYGEINIKNLFGRTVATVPMDAYYSLPRSQRYRQVVVDQGGLFGWYTAELSLNRAYQNSDDVVDVKTVSFVVIPLTYLLIVAGVAIVVWLAFVYLRKNFEFKRKGDA